MIISNRQLRVARFGSVNHPIDIFLSSTPRFLRSTFYTGYDYLTEQVAWKLRNELNMEHVLRRGTF